MADWTGDDQAIIAALLDVARDTDDLYVRVGPTAPTMSSDLRRDLGVDSIGRIALLYAVCDALGLEADEADAVPWATVGDVVAFVRRQTAEAS